MSDGEIRRTVEVRDPEGLHGRSLARIVRIVRGANAEVTIVLDGTAARADSMTQLSTLPGAERAHPGHEDDVEPYAIELVARGPEAENVAEDIVDFVRHNLKPKQETAVHNLRNAVRADLTTQPDLVDLLTEIVTEERVTEEQRRRLRYHRDHLRFCFGHLSRHLRLDEVERQAPEGVGKISATHAGSDWTGEMR